MSQVTNAVIVFLVGGLGWLSLEFLGRPFRRFFDLRLEAQRRVLLHAAQHRNYNKAWNDSVLSAADFTGANLSDSEESLLRIARHEIRDIGSQLVAFGNGEWPATSILRFLGFNAELAGTQLLHLEREMNEGNPNIIERRKAIFKALRMNH